jgi:hypothetical protein
MLFTALISAGLRVRWSVKLQLNSNDVRTNIYWFVLRKRQIVKVAPLLDVLRWCITTYTRTKCCLGQASKGSTLPYSCVAMPAMQRCGRSWLSELLRVVEGTDNKYIKIYSGHFDVQDH